MDNYDSILRRPNFKALKFYPKLIAIFDLTFYFTEHFLRAGDRTRDQMLQAARSGKQNIVEGSADAITSTKMEMELIACSRGSLYELLADYEDYLRTRNLEYWDQNHQRTPKTKDFCLNIKVGDEYKPYINRMNAEEFCNLCITLIHQAISLMDGYINMLERRFVTDGGFSENLYRARTDYRNKNSK